MGNNFSDLFFPDNPNRRRRAEQLENDVTLMQQEYRIAKETAERELGVAKEKLDAVLRGMGIPNLDALDKRIRETQSGSVLENWKKVSGTLDKLNRAESILYEVIGIIALVGFTVSLALGIFGIVATPVGFALTQNITLILGIIALIFSLINGAIQRDKLRAGIHDLSILRLRLRHSIDQWKIIARWAPSLQTIANSFFNNGGSVEELVEALKNSDHGFNTEFAESNVRRSANALLDMDRRRGAWMNEDPPLNDIISTVEREEAQYNPKPTGFGVDPPPLPPHEVGPDMLPDMELLRDHVWGGPESAAIPVSIRLLSHDPATTFLGCLEGAHNLSSQPFLLPSEADFKVILEEQIDASSAWVYLQAPGLDSPFCLNKIDDMHAGLSVPVEPTASFNERYKFKLEISLDMRSLGNTIAATLDTKRAFARFSSPDGLWSVTKNGTFGRYDAAEWLVVSM